jgi:tRNA (guanine37-N1)-methyltransferase
VQEAHDNPGVVIPALQESFERGVVLVVRAADRLVGAVRATQHGHNWDIGRIMVAPDLQGQGLGRWLLARIEEEAPADVTTYELFTGAGSLRNQRMYKKAGYRLMGEIEPGVVRLTKPRPAQTR